jgi:hypothetical protein
MAEDRPFPDWRAEVQRRLDAGHDVTLPYVKIELTVAEVEDMAFRRLRDISSDELRAGIDGLSEAIDRHILAGTDLREIREATLWLEGGKLALRSRLGIEEGELGEGDALAEGEIGEGIATATDRDPNTLN